MRTEPSRSTQTRGLTDDGWLAIICRHPSGRVEFGFEVLEGWDGGNPDLKLIIDRSDN